MSWFVCQWVSFEAQSVITGRRARSPWSLEVSLSRPAQPHQVSWPVCSFQRANSHQLLRCAPKNRVYSFGHLTLLVSIYRRFSQHPSVRVRAWPNCHIWNIWVLEFELEASFTMKSSVHCPESAAALSVKQHSCGNLSWKVELSIQSQLRSIIINSCFIIPPGTGTWMGSLPHLVC